MIFKTTTNTGIHFGSITVRSYSRTKGESVSGGGPAVGLGWDVYSEKKYKTLDAHEKKILMPRYRQRKQNIFFLFRIQVLNCNQIY